MAGLLGNPLVNIGAGLLAASGPSLTPNNLGAGLAQGLQLAQNAQQQGLRNQLVRSRLEDDARKRAATQKLGGLLGGENQEVMGLLSEIAPGAVAQGLLGKIFPRSNSTIDTLKAAGIDPASEEGRKAILSKFGGGVEAIQAQLEVLKAQQALSTQTREAKKDQREDDRNEDKLKFTIRSGIDKISELREINNIRKEVLDAPAAAMQKYGPIKLKEFNDRFNQLATQLIVEGSLDPLKNEAGSRMTDAGRRALFSAKISGSTLPNVASKALDDMEKGLNEAARIVGIPNATKKQAVDANQNPPELGKWVDVPGLGRVRRTK